MLICYFFSNFCCTGNILGLVLSTVIITLMADNWNPLRWSASTHYLGLSHTKHPKKFQYMYLLNGNVKSLVNRLSAAAQRYLLVKMRHQNSSFRCKTVAPYANGLICMCLHNSSYQHEHHIKIKNTNHRINLI